MTNLPPSGVNMRGAVDLSSLVNRPTPGAPATAGAAGSGSVQAGAPFPVPSLILEGTDTNFGELLELSKIVPVIVMLGAEGSEPSAQLTLVLENVVTEFDGAFVLAKVDVSVSPQLTQAFDAQSLPTVAAVINGQPVQLFTGVLGQSEVREMFGRLHELAIQQGLTGTVVAADRADEAGADAPAAVEPQLPPHHQAAYDAIDRGDYDTAIASYKIALAQNPQDTMAVAGLAQVSLLGRLKGKTIADIRSAAASGPADLDAQLLVADLDLSGGHIDDAFNRLLELFPAQDAAGKNRIRERVLELFEVVGADDPRVPPTRSRLTALLY